MNRAASESKILTELFVIPLTDSYLVYAPLRRCAFVANAATVNYLARRQAGGDEPVPLDAALEEFLRRAGIVGDSLEAPPVTRPSGPPRPTEIGLFLTTACNLRCTYCYASAGDSPRRDMSLETARRGLDFVIANAVAGQHERISIAYHGGGEPSANWDTLTKSWEYAREQTSARGLGLRSTLATNGVLGDARRDWIVRHLDEASVSWDGLPEVQDALRPLVNGRGSSEQVMTTLAHFDACEFTYGLRLTVTRDAIAKLPAGVEFVCDRFHPHAIQVEPVYSLGRWQNEPAAETQAFIDAFREAQMVARQHGREIYFSGARLGVLTNHFCGVSQDSFALTPDGRVSGCYEVFDSFVPHSDEFLYGRYDEAERRFAFELPVLDRLRDSTVDRRSFCDGCFAKWSCGGDCFHKVLAAGGAAEFVGTDRCHIIRELTKDQILERVAFSGGVVWNEGPS